ncbi:hypothetical protein PIB30_068183, partial [Stylosanthes scabra]|nr:hypothetical protein [Stylosanthes scabra]
RGSLPVKADMKGKSRQSASLVLELEVIQLDESVGELVLSKLETCPASREEVLDA